MKLESMQAELVKTKQKEQQLLKRIQAEQAKRLKDLPGLVGLKSIDELLTVLTEHASPHLRRGMRRSNGGTRSNAQSNTSAKHLRRDKRELFSVAVKERVKAEMQGGKKTMAQISTEHGPSIHTLRLWKRTWGLTKKMRQKKTKEQ